MQAILARLLTAAVMLFCAPVMAQTCTGAYPGSCVFQDDGVPKEFPTLGENGGTAGSLKLVGSGTGYVLVGVPTGTITSYAFTLPSTAGSSGYLLTSAAGSGPLTWTRPTVTVNGINCTLGSTCAITYPTTLPSITFNPSTSGILGTIAADSAVAGVVGETISSSVSVSSALTASTPANITSITLTPGDWDVCGSVGTNPAGGTTTQYVIGWTSTTSATYPGAPNGGSLLWMAAVSYTNPLAGSVGCKQYNVSTNTTVYLSIQTDFAVSTMTANGYVYARRRR